MMFLRGQVIVILIYLTIFNGRCFLLIKTDESETENSPRNGSRDASKIFLQNASQNQEKYETNVTNLTDLVKIGTLLEVREDSLNKNQPLQASKQDFYILKPHHNSSKVNIDNELEKRIRENYSSLKKLEDQNFNSSLDLSVRKDESKNEKLSLHSPVTQSLKISIPSKSYEITFQNQKTFNNNTNPPNFKNISQKKFTISNLVKTTELNSHNPVPENQVLSNKTNNKENLFTFGNLRYLLTPVSINSTHNDEENNKSNKPSEIVKLSQSETNKVTNNLIPIRTKYNRNTPTLLTKLLNILRTTPTKKLTPITIFRESSTTEKSTNSPNHDSQTFVDNAGNFIINQTLIPSYLIFKNNSTISFYPVRKDDNISIRRSKEFGRELNENFSDSDLRNIPENEISSTVVHLNNGESQTGAGESITITEIDSALHDQIQKLVTEPIVNNLSGVINNGEISSANSYNIDSHKEVEQKPMELIDVSPTIVKGVLVATSSNLQNSENVDRGLTSRNLNDQNFEIDNDNSEILINPLLDSSLTNGDIIINGEKEEPTLVGNSPNMLVLNEDSSSLSYLNTEPNLEIKKEDSSSVVKGILVKTSSDVISSENGNESSNILLPQETIIEVTDPIQENDDKNGNFKDTTQKDASVLQGENMAEGVLLLTDQIQSGNVDDTLNEPEKYTFLDQSLSSNINNPQMNLETINIQDQSGDVNIDLFMSKDDSNVVEGMTEIKNPVESSILPIFETEYGEGITKTTEDNSDLEAEIIKEYLQQGLPPGMNFVFNEEKDIPEIILSNNFLTSKDKIQITTSKGHKIIIRAENKDEVESTAENFEVTKEESQTTNTVMNQEMINLETSEKGSPIESYYDEAGHFVNEENAHLHVHDTNTPHLHTRDSEIYRNKGPLWWISTKDGFVPTGGVEATKGFVFKLKGETSDSSSNQDAETMEASFS
ncbi:hypothetical protein Avbf_05750 [Armadillidium vulgare]|nr:hypothetical protein Avbf_05750 [Armadillidium vulgare]